MGSPVIITPDQQQSAGPVTITPDPPGLWQRVKDWATTPGPLQQNQGKPDEAPGSFEGHPENVGEYIPATVGEAAGGVKDMARGNIARGAHRVISGAANATLPAAPFAAAGAPVATGAALLFGSAGQQIGKHGAEALGATEDQSDLAGDVGGLAGGYGGSKVPAGKIAQSMKVMAAPAAEAVSKLPVVDKVASAGRAVGKYRNVPGELSDIWKAKPADALGDLPPTGAKPASQTGEALGTIPRGSVAKWMKDSGAPLPEKPAPELLQSQPLATGPKAAPPRPSDSLGKIPARGSIAKSMKDPGAPLPEKPTPELLKSQPLATGPKPAPPRASDSLGTIPVRGSIAKSMQEPTPAPIKRGNLSELLQQHLEKGLDAAPPLKPNVPLRGQIGQAAKQAPADIPEGHVAIEGSSAVRSARYDMNANEFHARLHSGDPIYVYGDVSPEEAQAFNSAESKGQAFQALKQKHPLVAKIVNGKRVDVKPAARQ